MPERIDQWIALYGSLMRGLGAAESIGVGDGLRYAGPCTLPGELFDLGDYPGLRPGTARVVAELYAILDPAVVETLDDFEGFDASQPRESLYLRESVELTEPSMTRAWVYVYNHVPDASARIASGDWRAHIASKSSA